jgi:hypothetical protein
MVAMKLLDFPSSFSLGTGLRQLYKQGLGVRSLLFLAIDEHGGVHLAIADQIPDGKQLKKLKIGMKLSIAWPFEGRYFYFDSIHQLAPGTSLVNGDRRIRTVSRMFDVSDLVSRFIHAGGEDSVFFGCTPHQPGSWWIRDDKTIALHDRGLVEIVPTELGLVARRIMDDGLYFLPQEKALAGELDQWYRVFESPVGNILMLERRVKRGRLAISGQRGLVEVDVTNLPRVEQTGQVNHDGGYCILGRTSDGLFAVSHGKPRDWGYEEVEPAVLLGSKGGTFKELEPLIKKSSFKTV